jgi:hypothetical protein
MMREPTQERFAESDYDRKRSAIWALLATSSLVVAAFHDTLVWFNLFSARPWVPYGFSGCVLLVAIGFIRRRADPPQIVDLRESSRILANNRTPAQPQHRAKAPPRRQRALAAGLRARHTKLSRTGGNH